MKLKDLVGFINRAIKVAPEYANYNVIVLNGVSENRLWNEDNIYISIDEHNQRFEIQLDDEEVKQNLEEYYV